jgi:hypothetical protein
MLPTPVAWMLGFNFRRIRSEKTLTVAVAAACGRSFQMRRYRLIFSEMMEEKQQPGRRIKHDESG